MRATLLLCLFAVGCAWVGEDRYDRIRDLDQDGEDGVRFGGDDCQDDNPQVVDCDLDNDGFLSFEAGGDDCDDVDAGLNPDTVWYADADRDGVGGDDTWVGCTPPPNFVRVTGDCDDARADVAPGLPEFCDLIDHDCDGDLEEGAVDVIVLYSDRDGDGWGGDEVARACRAGQDQAQIPGDCDDDNGSVHPGATEICYDGVDDNCDNAAPDDCDGDGVGRDDDCDDEQPTVFPGAPEICDGLDNDCDGATDDEDTNVDAAGTTTWFADRDGDGFGNPDEPAQTCAAPPGFVDDSDDCDDTLASVNPHGTEACDLVDNDCNGVVDDWGAVGAGVYYTDNDGDGYGSDAIVLACRREPGLISRSGDCNDADPTIHPGAEEICGDQIRQDCSTAALDDCDGDGTIESSDCDDGAENNFPGNTEICDGQDNDCDGDVDSADASLDTSSYATWYRDADGDGYGDDGDTLIQCDQPQGYVLVGGDCADDDADRHPGADEVCDSIDNDCNGTTDLGPVHPPVFYYDGDQDGVGNAQVPFIQDCFPPSLLWVTQPGDCDDTDADVTVNRWYTDADGDGYGVESAETVTCVQPVGMVPGPLFDCDDADPQQNPGVAEVCDGIDNDCDGFTDNDVVGADVWYEDVDGDGYGDPDTSTANCVQPPGWVAVAGDCEPANGQIHPAATEVCDGFDNDCDALVDDADTVSGGIPWFRDADNDGFGDLSDSQVFCVPQAGYVLDNRDCNDADAAIHPGVDESCDNADNDCDGRVDDADTDSAILDGTPFYADLDADGYASAVPNIWACTDSGSYATTPGDDCDDGDDLVNPGVTETWYNGIDEDCDGVDDYDADDDGFTSDLYGGTDCNDADPDIYPGAPDTWYDGTDSDCANNDDNDQDGDGQYPDFISRGTDCSDSDPNIYFGAPDEWYDGIDSDCLGNDDYDQDGDGQRSAAYGGDDCDDTNPALLGGTLVVGPTGDFAAIQPAIQAACPGTTLQLESATFTESVAIRNKDGLALVAHPNSTTTPAIDGQYLDRVLTIEDSDVTLRGIALNRGVAAEGGAIAAYRSAVVVDGVAFGAQFTSDRGEALYASSSDVTLANLDVPPLGSVARPSVFWVDGGSLEVDGVAIDASLATGLVTVNADVQTDGLTVHSMGQAGTAVMYGVDQTGGHVVHDRLVLVANKFPALRVRATSSLVVTDAQILGEPNNWQDATAKIRSSGPVLITNALIGGAETGLELAGDGVAELRNVTLYGRGAGGHPALSIDGPSVLVDSSLFHASASGVPDGVAIEFLSGPFAPDVRYSKLDTLVTGFTDPVGTNGTVRGAIDFVSYHPNLPTPAPDGGRLYDFHLRRGDVAVNGGNPNYEDADGTRMDMGYFAGPLANGFYWIDTDSDGMPDGWEAQFGTDPLTADDTGDADLDLCNNLCEWTKGTWPWDDNTDNDGSLDNVDNAPLDPVAP